MYLSSTSVDSVFSIFQFVMKLLDIASRCEDTIGTVHKNEFSLINKFNMLSRLILFGLRNFETYFIFYSPFRVVLSFSFNKGMNDSTVSFCGSYSKTENRNSTWSKLKATSSVDSVLMGDHGVF